MTYTYQNLSDKLAKINKYFFDLHPELDHQTRVLGRIAKIAEEFGELTNEVLTSIGFQKKSKLDSYDQKHLEEEYADTLLALLLLGSYLKLDINQVLSAKLSQKLKDFKLT